MNFNMKKKELQNLFFNYLNKLDNEHGFQIFISSHSPTITAKANLKSVIVLQNKENKIHSLSLKKSGLTDENHRYLQKFLDVTKSQIFFSNGVILVEGISETLLLPIFSRIIGEDYDLSLIHISEPTRLLSISYAVFCLKKKTQ